ncbi:MAG TPA: bifunctional homocysteine S-methyltransferase/methylenetetrahydrofolate reductase [Bacteroidetes bacterium]|nr:bifunctional homocysteine S-methyltransferase/methylenetetrahydrofolate reductase [Bacteroidota bacterium]
MTSRNERIKKFREILKERAMVADGAMGTALYGRGIPFSRSFEELNLSNPELVKDIHRGYASAGAELHETNTFGANRIRLAPHGLDRLVSEINRAGVKIAREAVGGEKWLLGSVGPLGKILKPVGKIDPEEAREIFREQIAALVEGGVDLIILETFTDLREITQALLAAKDVDDVPVIAQMTFTEEGKSLMGDKPAEVVRKLRELGAEIVGANCSVGPQGIYEIMEIMAQADAGYLSAMPNAGMPKMIEGWYMYLSSPEYMAQYARRTVEIGVNIIGGCCGTTPEHIRQIREMVWGKKPGERTKKGTSHFQFIESTEITAPPEEEKSVRESNFAVNLGKKFLVSVEIDPPRGVDPEKFIQGALYLKGKGVDAINVADSPLARARMSPLVLSHLISEETGIETIMHLSCRDRNILGLQAELMGAQALGIRNILAITGDPPKLGDHPTATGVFDIDSVGLVTLIRNLNNGVDLMGRPIKSRTGFSIGVGVNPTAIDLDYEMNKFARKVEAGAQFAFTQPLFDLKILEDFLKRAEKFEIPIFVGILPLRNFKHAEFMHNEIPEMFVPEHIRKMMFDAGENGPEVGVQIAQKFLLNAKDRVDGVYLMPPFNKFEMAGAVLKVLE